MGYSWDDDSGSSGSSGGMSSGRGADFASARAAYTEPSKPKRSSRSRSSASRSSSASMRSMTDKDPSPPVGINYTTDSTHPIVVAVDHTGSMDTWPGIILKKLALFGNEVKRYAPEYAASFCIFGDVGDSYGLQVREPASGPVLEDHLGSLYPEGGGGDNPEDPGLAAYFYLNHFEMPKAVKPIILFITDASYHKSVSKVAIKKYTGDTVQEKQDTLDLLKALAEKFTCYCILKDYHSGGDKERQWEEAFGAQNVLPFEGGPEDVVEVLIGVVAGELGEYEDFESRSSKRHSDKPDRVSRVSRTLKSVKEKSKKSGADVGGKASMSGKKSGKSMKSKSLV